MKWMPVKVYPYSVSETGLIRSHYSKILIKPSLTPKGYHRVRLSLNGGGKNFMVHRLVAEAFIPNPSSLPVVNHKDGNKLNNAVQNLEWCSIGYNQLHAYAIGLRKQHVGEKHGRAKLSDGDVKIIRTIYSSGGVTYTDLAKSWGISKSMIGYIVKKDNWKHV